MNVIVFFSFTSTTNGEVEYGGDNPSREPYNEYTTSLRSRFELVRRLLLTSVRLVKHVLIIINKKDVILFYNLDCLISFRVDDVF
jgi:hypothetical protein